MFGRAELSSIDTGFAGDSAYCAQQSLGGFFGKHPEILNDVFASNRDTLRDRRSFGKDTVKGDVVPSGRKVHKAVNVQVGINQAGDGCEW